MTSSFVSVFVGFYPVALVVWLCAMIWLEILVVRARTIPAIHFTTVWNYLAIVAFIFWLLFYLR